MTNEEPEPLFVLGLHRGGTTLAQRLLNCHRDVVMWGENHALVTQLRLVVEDWTASPAAKVGPRAYQSFEDFVELFRPWANPYDESGLRRAFAGMLTSLYSPRGDDVPRHWGFKEIRHGNLEDITFLLDLFPAARVVTLVRAPEAVFDSQLHARWGPELTVADLDLFVDSFVSEYRSTVAAFQASADRWPDNVVQCRYVDVTKDPYTHLFDRIGLDPAGVDAEMVRRVRSSRAGSSFADVGRALDDQLRTHAHDRFRQRWTESA